MVCPYCQQPTFETLKECQACRFSLAGADRLFGAVPRLQPGVTDLMQILSQAQIGQLEKLIKQTSVQFPQLNVVVTIFSLPESSPFGAYLYWLFNRGGICNQMEKGGANRSLLFGLDTTGSRAGWCVGYGLEPFVGPRHLQTLLEPSLRFFRKGEAFQGLQAGLEALPGVLTLICRDLSHAYGVDLEKMRELEASASGRKARVTYEEGVY